MYHTPRLLNYYVQSKSKPSFQAYLLSLLNAEMSLYCDWKNITAIFLLNMKHLQTTSKHIKFWIDTEKSAEPKTND